MRVTSTLLLEYHFYCTPQGSKIDCKMRCFLDTSYHASPFQPFGLLFSVIILIIMLKYSLLKGDSAETLYLLFDHAQRGCLKTPIG